MHITLKLSIVSLTVFMVLSCTSTSTKKKDSPNENPENFDWLLGKWKRLNEEMDKETFENWHKISLTEYSGIGFTMQNGDTIKQERIRIIKQNETWNLVVKIPDEPESIVFPITELKIDNFTCTNDSLDFPKKIKYWKEGSNINALVAGDSLRIDFEFERMEQ